MLSVLADLQYVGIGVISVADNFDSNDEEWGVNGIPEHWLEKLA